MSWWDDDSSGTSCTTWGSILETSEPVSIRHFCLLSKERFVAPRTVSRNCLQTGKCQSCFTFDGADFREDCDYRLGNLTSLGLIPPEFSDYAVSSTCPIGYELFSNVLSAPLLRCPFDSVMVLEVFSGSETNLLSNINLRYATTPGVRVDYQKDDSMWQCDSDPDIQGTVLNAVGCTWLSNEESAIKPALTIASFHAVSKCIVNSVHDIDCDDSNYVRNYPGGCQGTTNNQLLCEEVENENEPQDGEENTNEGGEDPANGDKSDEAKKEFLECGMDTFASLKNPVSIGVGVAVVVVSLIPLRCLSNDVGANFFSPSVIFEALTSGITTATAISFDVDCYLDARKQSLVSDVLGSTVIFAIVVLLLVAAELILLIAGAIAVGRGKDNAKCVDDLKFSAADGILIRIIRSFVTLLFAAASGFLHFAAMILGSGIAEDSVGTTISPAYYFVTLSVGGLGSVFAFFLWLYACCVGNFQPAWKIFKICAADIPGLVLTIQLAITLSIGWGMETLNDILQIVLSFI